MACVFDLFSQHPLMFTAAAGSCSGNDFRAIGNKFTKLLRVGISRLFFLRTKKTELFSSGGIFIGTFLVVLFRFFEWHRLELYNFGRDLAINKYSSNKFWRQKLYNLLLPSLLLQNSKKVGHLNRQLLQFQEFLFSQPFFLQRASVGRMGMDVRHLHYIPLVHLHSPLWRLARSYLL